MRLLGEVGETQIKGEGKEAGLKEWNFSLTRMLLPFSAPYHPFRVILAKCSVNLGNIPNITTFIHYIQPDLSGL